MIVHRYRRPAIVLALALFALTNGYSSTSAADEYNLRESFKPTLIINNYDQAQYLAFVPYVITTPGYYIVVDDLPFSPTADGQAAIVVDSDNVIVDFNSSRLYAVSTPYVDLIGVYVAPNIEGVSIRSGTINSLNGVGIYLDTGASDINITNMEISDIAGGGILANGSTNIFLSDIITDSIDTTDSNFAYGFAFNNVNVIEARNCSCNNNTALNADAYGMFFNTCSAVRLTGCLANGHFSGFSSCLGYNIYNSTAFDIEACSALANTTTGASTMAAGFLLNSCSSINIANTKSRAHSSSNGYAYGFVSSNGTANKFVNTEATGNNGGVSGYGFSILGTDKQAIISSSIISGNASPAGTAYGIFVDTPVTSLLANNNTIIDQNNSATGYGIYDASGNATINNYFANFLLNDMNAFNFTSATVPVYTGPLSGTPGTYQNVSF